MTYFVNLFSPETYEAFLKSDRTVSGFRGRQHAAAEKVQTGDKLVCYLTKLSRWVGVLEVVEGPYEDRTPIFYPDEDPFVVRFRVKPLHVLDVVNAIPIHEEEVWSQLSFTRDHDPKTSTWTGKLRASLAPLDRADGELIERLIERQASGDHVYPFNEDEYAKLLTLRIRRSDRDVFVSVPRDGDSGDGGSAADPDIRESHRVQGAIAEIGARMGMSIWVPAADRRSALKGLDFVEGRIVDRLPLNYDETTLKTIENIDVLWLKGRSIVRAFEVEHTTAVYSGILRMADLLALQPNMEIKLHIVAPESRRAKVFDELRRPVFSLLDRGPLAETCTFLSYDNLDRLSKLEGLEHMRDSILEEYVEEAE